MNASRVLLGLVSLGAAACSVPLDSAEPTVQNACAADSDCAGGACVSLTRGNTCVATEADLSGIILEVRAGPDTNETWVFDEGFSLQGTDASGIVLSQNLGIPPPVEFQGKVIGPAAGNRPCQGELDQSIPVTVELRAAADYVGLGGTYTVDSEVSGADAVRHAFHAPVPAGRYDLHVRPQACDADDVPPPPVFLAGVEVDGDIINVPLPAPSYLGGTLTVPEGQDITGWTLELVEPRHGLSVSEVVPLSADMVSGGVVPIVGLKGVSEGIAYSWPGPPPLIRLRDADGQLTVHWALAAVDLDGDGRVALQLFDLQSQAKSLEATVVDEDGNPLAASVTIQSKVLTGSANNNASFRVRAETDADGLFAVDLVPGTYTVVAEPVGDDVYARVVDEWTVKESDLCCGRSLTMFPKSVLSGTVRSATGQPLANAPVVAFPASLGFLTYFESTVEVGKAEALSALPRQASGVTGLEGEFEVPADPGSFDLFIRPEAETGFPWLIRPQTLVQGGEEARRTELGDLTMANPAIMAGTVLTEDGAAPGAIIRAWLPVDGDGTLDAADAEEASTRVVQIGETTAGPDGVYVLPLPPTITLTKPANDLQ